MDNFGTPVDVIVKDEGWTALVDKPEMLCPHVIDTAKSVLETCQQGEISIALVNDADIRQLNKTYRHKDKPTNVLSFPNDGPALILGDIVIARETVQREAKAAQLSLQDHLTHMLVHGFLHLQGYDHENDPDAVIMEALEIKALALLNIDNPYKIHEPSPS